MLSEIFTLSALPAAMRAHQGTLQRLGQVYTQLARLGGQRDATAGQMRDILLGAAFAGRAVNAGRADALIGAGDRLLGAAAYLTGLRPSPTSHVRRAVMFWSGWRSPVRACRAPAGDRR